jgi:hypothetical protein
VKLELAELAQLVKIIDGIHGGKEAPRIQGRVGLFLRTCQSTRFEVQQVLAREGVRLRPAGWASGHDLGPIELDLLGELRGAVVTDLWGPVEHAPALSEQLGSVVDLTLWTSARSANRAHVLAAAESEATLEMVGGYRWFPTGRVTPGDGYVGLAAASGRSWERARFLKATADDFGKAPHPLEYILDYRLGPPSLKAFRVFAIRKISDGFEVLPGLHGAPQPVTLGTKLTELDSLEDGAMALVFAYREPWSADWEALAASRVGDAECVGHTFSWGDFAAELRGAERLTSADVATIRRALSAAGIDVPSAAVALELANLERRLLPTACAVTRWLRYRT